MYSCVGAVIMPSIDTTESEPPSRISELRLADNTDYLATHLIFLNPASSEVLGSGFVVPLL